MEIEKTSLIIKFQTKTVYFGVIAVLKAIDWFWCFNKKGLPFLLTRSPCFEHNSPWGKSDPGKDISETGISCPSSLQVIMSICCNQKYHHHDMTHHDLECTTLQQDVEEAWFDRHFSSANDKLGALLNYSSTIPAYA